MSTLGESRVGVDFNPGGNPVIAEMKQLFADLVDDIGALPDHGDGEIKRLKAIAQSETEGSAMWAVKAAARSAAADKES